MKTVTVPEAAAALGVSIRRLQTLLVDGRVVGAKRVGSELRGIWLIPVGRDGKPKVTEADGPGPKLTWKRKAR